MPCKTKKTTKTSRSSVVRPKKKAVKAKVRKTKKTKIPVRLLRYLEDSEIKHEILEHKTVYTAIDAAKTLKRKVGEVAKSLLVKADRDYYLILLPADRNLDFEKLRKVISKEKGKEVKSVKIPGEKIMEKALKIKAGTLSAFGKFHKIPVVLDRSLTKIKKGIFSAGSLNHSIEMTTKNFLKLEEVILGSFSRKKKVK